MNVTKTIRSDLADQGSAKPVEVLSGDLGTRSICFELMEEGRPWTVPEGVTAALYFQTDWGSEGAYDTMPDGTAAARISGSQITVRLHDAVLSQAGTARLSLVLRDEKLSRLSSFPLVLKVEESLADAEPVAQRYYHLQTLDQVNEAVEDLRERLDAVDTAEIRAAAQTAREAAKLAVEAAGSVDAEQVAEAIKSKGDGLYVDPDTGELCLMSGETVLEQVELPEGLSFDGGFVAEDGYLHLTLEGQDIAGFTPFYVGSGGGAASVLRLSTTLQSRSFSIRDTDETCVIPFGWSSAADGEETGSGVMEWTVNGSRVAMEAVEQGDREFDIRPYLMSAGENAVTLKITDVYGTFRTLTLTITVVSYGLSWNLGETAVHEGAVLVQLTPTGVGEKLVKVAVDGTVVSETVVSTTGRKLSVTVPVQAHGVHTVTAWLEATVEGQPMQTDPIFHVGCWALPGYTAPMVGLLTPALTVGRYGTAAVRYVVVDPVNEYAAVTLSAGGETVTVLENVGRDIQTWNYKADTVGEISLGVACGAAVGRCALTVTELAYPIEPVTAGLVLDLDPSGHHNLEAGAKSFGYTDGSGVNHPLIFSENFDWTRGGFKTDDQGVTTFVVPRGCSVSLDTSLFSTDPSETGRQLKVIFKSENVRNYDATLMSCKSGNVGMVIQAQKAAVTSTLETLSVPYCEGRKIEMDVTIEPETLDRFACISLNAVYSCPPVRWGDTDSWVQTNPVPLVIGSEEADVWLYRLKAYDTSHNRYEMLDNFIADCGDPAEMVARFERNDIYNTDGTISLTKLTGRNKKLRSIHIKAKRMTTGKDDEVVCDIEIVYEAGGKEHKLIIINAVIKAQGTSSLEYILAALNLDADLAADGCVITDGNGNVITAYAMRPDSIPVSYFNLKANVASSESANNVVLADDYNEFNPYVCAPKAADPRVRDTVEGNPCAVFFTNTAAAAIQVGARTVQAGETILYFVGDMNNSKKNFEVFGQDNAKWPKQCCVEVMNNTEEPCRFLRSDFEHEAWKDGNFEFRFPKNPTQEMKDAFIEMQTWVVSTARARATGEPLGVPVTYGGKAYAYDTAEYRGAKFVAEFDNYFVRDAMLFHYLFTERHCMTDNRAKNLFCCYEYVAELEDYRWSVRCDYDNDTAEGCDNSGGATFTYGIEDTDIVGETYAFNAHDSTLWCNIRDLMHEDLKALYIRLKGQGAWSAQRILDKFLDHQSAVPEALRSEDMWNKYFTPWLSADASAYALKCHGDKRDWREQFERYQERYMDSKYCDTSDRSDVVSTRVTVSNSAAGNFTIVPYADMYLVVMYGNGGTVSVRAKRNQETLIECPTDSLTDTETYLFGASRIISISSFADMKPKFVLATTAEKLQNLVVGSGEIGYQNLNMNQLGVGNNPMLERLDLRGLPNLTTNMDMSGLTSLEEFYGNGSGITGVTFARGCPLKIARVGAVTSFVALDLRELETFVMDPGNLTILRVEGCPAIDTLSICKGAPNLTRGRLIDVDWTDDDPDLLLRLAGLQTMGGMDAQGGTVDGFVLTGRAYVATAMQGEIDTIRAAFPELSLTVGETVASHIVEFVNHNGDLEDTQIVRHGAYAIDPVQSGRIATPTKAADVEYTYSFIGWDQRLGPVTGDLVIKAQFNASDRYYTVTHWADQAESTVGQTKTVIAHGACPYEGADPSKAGSLWMGWDAEADDVVCDMDIHPVFVTPELPGSVASGYDCLWSNDESKNSGYTTAQLLGILQADRCREFFAIGDRIHFAVRTDAFADLEFVLELRSFKHFESAQREGFAGPYFGMVGVMNATQRMNIISTNAGGWPATDLRAFLNETVFPALPKVVRMMIEQIRVRSSAGDTSAAIVEVEDWLTIESVAELGCHAEAVPHCDEIAQGADEVAFPCYTNAGSRIKKHHNGAGTAPSRYWTRSPLASSRNEIYSILGSSGGDAGSNPPTPLGVSFGFCLKTGEEVGA